ncbi:MAG TPA: ABC transporter substrate-binding protein [Nocardia sp.]|nr:ABC transporter substrate-binding protein [Nocardia sp.]HLS79216.1 ABC transporter substrate-binding protein [Nocardia sp.]
MRKLLRKTAVALLAVGLLTSCATADSGDVDLTAALPESVPEGVDLRIAVRPARVALTASGLIEDLSFTVSDWPAISGGPDIIQAFRGGALDIAANAGLPPIHAHATGFDAKIIGVKMRSLPIYQLATAPGVTITDASQLRGKRIAFSPGQAQGAVVLRTLKDAGIGLDEVELVELNSPQFLSGLQGNQIDVAPLGEPSLTKYLDSYRAQGAGALEIEAVDALSIIWAPTSVLRDSAKLAAATEFVEFWARGEVWAWENQDEWIRAYYVEDQEVSAEDGRRILDRTQKPYFPDDWDAAIAWEQETIDLVTESGFFGAPFDAEVLFDRRFEKVAAEAVPAEYRVEEKQ